VCIYPYKKQNPFSKLQKGLKSSIKLIGLKTKKPLTGLFTNQNIYNYDWYCKGGAISLSTSAKSFL